MNIDNLHRIIERYENSFEMINDSEHNENFKWAAVRCFRDVWFSEKAKNVPFAELFAAATRNTSVLINNSMISPTQGIVKMAEKRPEETEKLFREVLFADFNTIDELQNRMEEFLEKTEKLRLELFPRLYRYKQERHAASCYLFFFAPETHYIYRYSDAEEFAMYTEYGKNLGAGTDFKLENYYELAGILADAIKEHPILLSKHEALFRNNDNFYYDENLHLLAFDIMYCSRAYNLYAGMSHVNKKDSIEAYTLQQMREKEAAEQKARAEEIQKAIHNLEVKSEQFEEISLMGVEVTQEKYGTGSIIEQSGSRIKVRFENGEEHSYVINKQYAMRPRFENDEEIVDAFTEFDRLNAEKSKLEKELRSLNI